MQWPQGSIPGSDQFQQMLTEGWKKALDSFQSLDLGALSGSAGSPQLSFDPAQLQQLQQQYVKDAASLWNDGLRGGGLTKDRRFAGDAWSGNPVAAFSAAAYLLNARTLLGLSDAMQADAKTRARVRFAVEQWLAASAPSNSASTAAPTAPPMRP